MSYKNPRTGMSFEMECLLFAAGVVAIVAVAFLAGCGGGSSEQAATTEPYVPPADIEWAREICEDGYYNEGNTAQVGGTTRWAIAYRWVLINAPEEGYEIVEVSRSESTLDQKEIVLGCIAAGAPPILTPGDPSSDWTM